MSKELTNKTFDYSVCEPEVKGKLIWYAGQVRREIVRHVESGIEMGRLLSEARDLLGKSFREWVENECGHAVSSAYRYISAYENFGSCPNLGQIELSAMYELTSNESAKKRALKLADKGVKVTYTMAKKLIADATPKAKSEPVSDEPDEPETVEEQASETPAEPSEEWPFEQVDEPIQAADEPQEDEPEIDYGKCPNCLGTKWTDDGLGVSCAKCNHPHGEPTGGADEERISTQRQKTVKTIEAAMRCFDDLQLMKPYAEHEAAIGACKALLEIAKGWK